ncbi:hypothetical protein G6F70_008211 [Rhizopus microsporus]|uniref:Uncharacterized protein n=1 Tax=Rhizopus azygosporus TaxID=86630 RepID=A0A367K865_RHIAZ|nr:hypothetical protein G6F71_008212 [Rhizopus microsporus]RCH98319.1 hypothetical protein CU097_013031 [Rhizopus azygosporus]KAG1195470.1 hypothetical protein G6F70_008211 [Rhizopus microsporus]KAG1207277.1 hypothetical protein G6F69_008180 [Rhizopus microsporus]KAG1227964.1 hypothetical protein G6F67_008122 [Rhizopus microsporus]
MKRKNQDNLAESSSKGKKTLKSDDLDNSVTSTLTTSASTSLAPPPLDFTPLVSPPVASTSHPSHPLASAASSSSALSPTSKKIQK